MAVQFGADVYDKDGILLGTVDHIRKNLLTGEPSLYVVRRRGESDLMLSPDDIADSTGERVQLKVTHDELVRR